MIKLQTGKIEIKSHMFQIHLADYLPQNRDELYRWVNNESKFDWTIPLRMILTREGRTWDKLSTVEPETRDKVFNQINKSGAKIQI